MNLATYPPHVVPTLYTECSSTTTHGPRPMHAEGVYEVRPGTDLCGLCHSRFPRVLGDLVGHWKPLQEARIKVRKKDYSRDRVKGGGVADVGALWNPAASVALAEIEEWTRYVIRTVLRDRRFFDTEPLGFTVDRNLEDTTTPIPLALAQLAIHHSTWLTEYPRLGPALLQDAVKLRTRAIKANDQPAVRRVNMRDMYCAEELIDLGYGVVTCGAPMAGVLTDDGAATPAVILCSANPSHRTSRLERKDWINHLS